MVAHTTVLEISCRSLYDHELHVTDHTQPTYPKQQCVSFDKGFTHIWNCNSNYSKVASLHDIYCLFVVFKLFIRMKYLIHVNEKKYGIALFVFDGNCQFLFSPILYLQVINFVVMSG